MVEAGLNVFQILQNELLTREGNRQTLGLGFRLAIIEDKITNAEAVARNGRVWKLNHAVAPLKALTPDARRRSAQQRRILLNRKGADRRIDEKDPVKLMRDQEIWDICEWFPRTVLEFKELQFDPKCVRELMEHYDVKAYRPDMRMIQTQYEDDLRDVEINMETCMEELAMCFGLDWHKIGGLALPPRPPVRQGTTHTM